MSVIPVGKQQQTMAPLPEQFKATEVQIPGKHGPSTWQDLGITTEAVEQYWEPRWSFNAAKNFHDIEVMGPEKVSLNTAIGRYKGKTIVVTGGGPSLDDNIKKLKTCNREDYILMSSTSTLNCFMANDIIPDYVVCNDGQAWLSALHYSFIDMDKLQNTPIITMTSIHNRTIMSWPGPKLLYNDFAPHNDFLKFGGPLHAMYPHMTLLPCSACVTNVSVRISMLLGARYILMIGADQGFTYGLARATKYWKDTEGKWQPMVSPQICYQEDGQWQLTPIGKTQLSAKTFCIANGVPSSGEYVFYIEDLEHICNLKEVKERTATGETVSIISDIDVINCTEGGAIKHLPTMPIDTAIQAAKDGKIGFGE